MLNTKCVGDCFVICWEAMSPISRAQHQISVIHISCLKILWHITCYIVMLATKYMHKMSLSYFLFQKHLNQASTDGFLSICPFVHLRPHFQNFNGPSSESVHEVDGPCSSTVHLRPFITNDHGPSSESVHEVDGPYASAVHHRPSVTNNHGPLSESVHEVRVELGSGWN